MLTTAPIRAYLPANNLPAPENSTNNKSASTKEDTRRRNLRMRRRRSLLYPTPNAGTSKQPSLIGKSLTWKPK